ncbi:hypothetical protein HY624_01400 [Candidatus Uhrbacteria bacterium]|nr:hypothetical protein [Candidatus Uhrbacteria bacterium]
MSKVLLIILDGWGIGPMNEANVFSHVATPTFDHCVAHYPVAALAASGEAVGLAPDEVGNSESGHWNLGTGQRFRPEIWNTTMIQSTTSLGAVIARAGKKQLHISETEKYVHATYFFNGGHASPFQGEDDILVPSPKVSSYDEKPAMSARLITRRLVQALESGVYDFFVVNYPNLDIIAHTGNRAAVIKALAIIDRELALVTATALQHGVTILMTADHGNIEQITEADNNTAHRTHTFAPVPFIFARPDLERRRFVDAPVITRDLSPLPVVGALRDVPVTILELLGLEKPMGMEGASLTRLLPKGV